MVKRTAAVGVVALMVLGACGAVCQDERRSLPNAPSAQLATQAQRFNGFAEAGTPLRFGAMGAGVGAMRPGAFDLVDKPAFRRKDADAIFQKYLYGPSVRQQSGSRSTSNGSLGRAGYAASRTMITRDESGKSRLNTSYLLRTLSSVAKDAAATPYWRRSLAQPVSDFGATVGNDAGMNLWHEFGPSVEHLLKSHTPTFVSRIGERLGRM